MDFIVKEETKNNFNETVETCLTSFLSWLRTYVTRTGRKEGSKPVKEGRGEKGGNRFLPLSSRHAPTAASVSLSLLRNQYIDFSVSQRRGASHNSQHIQLCLVHSEGMSFFYVL